MPDDLHPETTKKAFPIQVSKTCTNMAPISSPMVHVTWIGDHYRRHGHHQNSQCMLNKISSHLFQTLPSLEFIHLVPFSQFLFGLRKSHALLVPKTAKFVVNIKNSSCSVNCHLDCVLVEQIIGDDEFAIYGRDLTYRFADKNMKRLRLSRGS